MAQPQSLYDKLWERHEVLPESDDYPGVLYIDLHLIHEVTSPAGFTMLERRGIPLRRADRTLGMADHSTPTTPPTAAGQWQYGSEDARAQVEKLLENCERHGVQLFDMGHKRRGIVHVVGPELGASQPGMTIVCGDSHTSTHGAFGALAFGIGSTEVGHVMATQCLLQRKAKSMRIRVDGELGRGISAKDLILHIIGKIGVDGGTGHAVEYAGSGIEALDMEARMTVCNMSIEAGARAGMIAPDATTIEYLRGRPMAPSAEAFESAAEDWLSLRTDNDAAFDREVSIDATAVAPTVTYGTNPGMVAPIDQPIPEPTNESERRALEYMQVTAGKPLAGHPIDMVFIGSCTNARMEDLRAAARVMRGKRVAEGVRMLVVPGSETVRGQAEAEGLHEVFTAAGAEWRQPGCSMCLAMNGDIVPAGKTSISTSNRNFEGRQGPGARTLLASPATAAASAVAGSVADPRIDLRAVEVA
ncbi:MAG: 3-isopropylmalate dehydratase large subunit [Pseudomonadota bacterium]